MGNRIARTTLRPKALLLAALLALLPAAAVAQSTYGTINGVVIDPSKAVVRDATVQSVNTNTGAARSTKTDADGFFRFLNLDPGAYTVTVEATGFAKLEQKNVNLLAREDVRLADLQLALASAQTQTVEVTATPVVTEQLTISDSKSGDTINSLALNFRATANPSPIVVANLAPGVNSDQNGNQTYSGQLPNATSFSLDGISTQLPRYGGPTKDLFPSVEGIAEFRVNTAANNAEFAQPTDLTVVSKSGTNQFHGSGFWFLQRLDFNSADQISHIVPTGDANTFGGSFGGPLTIPGVYNGKDRTFFFFDYEGVRLDQTTVIQTFTPPAAWRTGNFSATGVTIIDPTTGQPFPGNMIPLNRISSVAQKVIPLFFPNPTNSSPVLTTPNLVVPFPGSYKDDGFDGRLDHVFSGTHQVFVRVTQKDPANTGTDTTSGDTVYNPLQGPFTTGIDLLNIAGAWNWILRPNLINEFRAGYSKANYTYSYPQAKQGDSIVSSLGIQGLPGTPVNGLGGTPVFYIGDLLGGATNQYGHPEIINNGTFQFGDNMSWVHGRHSVKFGFDFRRLNFEPSITFLNGDEYGDYFFTGDFTAVPGQKNGDVNGFADFLLGYVADAKQAKNGPNGKPYGFHYGGFIQDEWHVQPNLAINVGLRYEVNTPFNDETNQLGNFDRNYPGGRLIVQGQAGLALVSPPFKALIGNTPIVTNTQAGLPITLRKTDFSNVQPRLGLAYRPGNNNKTVIRASGGIYSVPVLGAVLYSLLAVDTSFFADYPSSPGNIRTFPNPFAGNAAGPSGYASYRRANQFDLKDPTVIQWNFSIDHDMGWGTLVRLSYTGSHTYNLIYSPDLNQVMPNTVGYAALTATPALRQQNLKYPNFAEVLTRDNGPRAKYEAVSFELNKRFSNGIQFNNSYTFAKNITNALGTASNSAVPVGGQVDNGGNAQDIYNIAMDTGNAYFTPRNRFVSTFVYNLPFGRGQKFAGSVSRAADLVVGGWSVTGVTLLQSGNWLTPYFPTSTADPSGTNPSQRSVAQQRPDCVAGMTGYLSNPTTADYFNASAFVIPASNIGRYGTCGTGILEGPGTATFSMSAGKTFRVTERVGVRYEAQFSNLFNILNKANPNMNVGSSSFGLISSSQLTQQAGPRSIQMMLRIQF